MICQKYSKKFSKVLADESVFVRAKTRKVRGLMAA
jgi:hypothetical protein